MPPPRPPLGTILCILLISSFLLCLLSLRMISQIHISRADQYIQKEYYGLAISRLEKAAGLFPENAEKKGGDAQKGFRTFFRHLLLDDSVYRRLGEAYFRMSRISPDIKTGISCLEKSAVYYRQALTANPLDMRIPFGLALAEWQLEKIFRMQGAPQSLSAYQALPHFRQAVRLRPHGIQNNFSLLRYLAWSGKEQEMFSLIRKLVRNYPPLYHYLKKENFWSDAFRSAGIQGLEEAIEKNILPRHARMILSGIMAEDKKWDKAVFHYEKALTHRSFENLSAHYYGLGRLLFYNGEKEKARREFLRGLHMSRKREKDLEQLYLFYRKQEETEAFSAFLWEIRDIFRLSFRAEILMARVEMDLQNHAEAKKILHSINERRPEAEAFYWLARIAEQEKDWDSMEIFIQKATVHDPENRHYHAVFANVLRKLKKFERARKEDALAKR